MHHQPDFERDQDRERREGSRGGRDEGRLEQRGQGQEWMETDDYRQRGRDDGGEEHWSRNQQGGQGQHQQYSQTYGQGQYGGNQGYGQERYGNQGYGGQGQYGSQGGFSGGQGQFGGGQYGYGNQGQQYGGNQYDQERYGNQGYGNQGQYGQERYGNQYEGQSGRFGGNSQYERGRGQSQGQSHGQFRGKGPKDWTRSDERIREEVCELLADADEVDASEITWSDEVTKGRDYSAAYSIPEGKKGEPAIKGWISFKEKFGNTFWVAYETHPNAWNAVGKSFQESARRMLITKK